MSETSDTSQQDGAPARAPAEMDSGEDKFNRRAAILIACVAVLAAIVTALQTNASAQSATANRDAQRYALQAMGHRTSGQTQVSYDRQGALQTWSELNDLALASSTIGDEPAAARYRDVRDRIARLSSLLAAPYFDPEMQTWPDISAYETDVYLVETTALTERYAASAALFDAWGDKANTYVVHLTLLAVALSLIGLSTTLSSGARKLFVIVGLGIIGVTLVWAVTVFLSPLPTLPEEAIQSYARGVGLNYQNKTREAVTAFDESLAKAPDYANAFYERGNAYFALSNYEAATADYEKARSAGRDDTNVGWNLGWTYYLLGRFDDAKRIDLRVLDIDPNLIGVRLNLALTRLAVGENAAAKQDYADAIDTATRLVVEARAAGKEPPASLWVYLDAGSTDLQNLVDRLDGRERDWTEAPQASAIQDPDSVRRIAQEMIQELKSVTVALEYSSRPPEKTVTAKITPFSFGKAIYGSEGNFVNYEVAPTFAYHSKEVLVLFDYEGMRPGQDVIFKVYINRREYDPLRQVVKWPDTLGESGKAQYPLSYAYSKVFILPIGEYDVDMYVDWRLVQRGSFSVKEAHALMTGDAGTMLYHDDFSDVASGWGRYDGDDYIIEYVNGGYNIYVSKPNLVVQNHPGLNFGDVSVEVDATLQTGSALDGNFGITCRRVDADNYYLLHVTADGYYGISKLKAGEWTTLGAGELQFSEAIQQGEASNHLRADCVGDTLTLYANDELLIEAVDPDFTSGDVGLLAGTYDTAGADVTFDNLMVRQPGGAPPSSSSTLESGNILFEDDFGDPASGWPATNEGDYITEYADGGYRILVSRDQYSVWSTPGLDLSDVSITVDATKVGGPDQNNFGVVCRYLDGDNFYALEVSSDGYYSILKRLAGEWTFLGADDWQFSDMIPQGEATLHIRADCAGDTLAFYLDDVKLLEAQDADLTSGDVGLLAGTYETTGVDLLFDDFSVKQP